MLLLLREEEREPGRGDADGVDEDAERRVGPVGRALAQVTGRERLERLRRRRLGVRALAEEGRVRVEEEAGVAVVEGGHLAPAALSPSEEVRLVSRRGSASGRNERVRLLWSNRKLNTTRLAGC